MKMTRSSYAPSHSPDESAKFFGLPPRLAPPRRFLSVPWPDPRICAFRCRSDSRIRSGVRARRARHHARARPAAAAARGRARRRGRDRGRGGAAAVGAGHRSGGESQAHGHDARARVEAGTRRRRGGRVGEARGRRIGRIGRGRDALLRGAHGEEGPGGAVQCCDGAAGVGGTYPRLTSR